MVSHIFLDNYNNMHSSHSLTRKNSQTATFTRSHSDSFNPNLSQSLRASPHNFRRRAVKPKTTYAPLHREVEPYIEQQLQQAIKPSQELRFLAQLVKRKQSTPDRKETPQPTAVPIRPTQDYEYYDMIVRDLISEIRTRNQPPKPVIKITAPKERTQRPKYSRLSPRKGEEQQIKMAPFKQKMVFDMSLTSSDQVYERKITSFVQFLYKLNFSNGLYVDLTLSQPKTTYRVKVGRGNNGSLVRSLLKRRFWLEVVNSGPCHFYWTQLTDASLHESQDPATRHSPSSTAAKPPKRLRLLGNSPPEVQLKIMRSEQIPIANEWYERSDCGSLSPHHKSQPVIITNHLPLNCIIGAKRILFRVMRWFYNELLDSDPFDIIPETYNFESGGTEYKPFVQKHQKSRKMWIVKPGQNTNRGKGIRVVDSKGLMSILARQRMGRPLIVQQYLKPFLYNGRKLDIRHFLLVTSHNGHIKGYWFHQGYLRTSSEKYDIEDMDPLIHLTNDAIQKDSDRYGKYQPGNKLSYSQFQRYLDHTYPHKHYNFTTQVLDKMKEVTANMLRGAFQWLDPGRKEHNFELFGLDFYITNKFKPYLIECNANPCLQMNCPLLERLVPCAVEHALRVALDPLLPPPTHYPPAARYHLCDRALQKLKYQLIFDQKYEGRSVKQATKSCRVKLDLGGIKLRPEEDEFDDEGEQLGQACILE